MEIEFFNKDAREVFLEPNSVDLFLIHPPFFQKNRKEYGGDPLVQLHNVDSHEEFLDSMLKCIKNMETALRDTGTILLILPNTGISYKVIADIVIQTGLTIRGCLIWNFEKSDISDKITGSELNLILCINKNDEVKYSFDELDSSVISFSWDLDTRPMSYQKDFFVLDAMPSKIPDILIPIFSKEGDTVVDIMAGTGTVVISALKNNRKAIYNDVSIDQVNGAKKIVSDMIGYTSKEIGMNKDKAIDIMMESINEDNLALGLQSGLEEAVLKSQIKQSQQSLSFMMANIYDKLRAGGVIA